RSHELLALRVAWRCRSEFEWAEHFEYARAAGLSDTEIDAVAGSIDDGPWTSEERALLRAADELVDTSDVSDGRWAVRAPTLEGASLGEAVFVGGQYAMLSMVANATGIPKPEDGVPLPPRDDS